jgi:hypothetical protein
MQADTLIADKAFDADERVIAPLAAAGKTAVIPPKANRRLPRDYDQYIYQARHLMTPLILRWHRTFVGRGVGLRASGRTA